MTSATISV